MGRASDEPDLLVTGRVHTLDPVRPVADAVLVRAGRIACVGTERECAARTTAARTIRAGSAVPGLADAHGHVEMLGRARLEVSCAGWSEKECAERVVERVRSIPPGRWVLGRGWDQNFWTGRRFPSAAILTKAVPNRPVALSRIDGHALWVNAAALQAAGIGPGTPDPPGGRIVRGPGGEPAGVLVDAAQELVLRAIPPPTPEEVEEALLLGMRELASLGLTAVHDAGVRPASLEVYRKLAVEDRLPLRVYAMIDGQVGLPELRAEMARWKATSEVGRLTVRAVKVYADGALGSRGAALFEDYSDDPGNRGLLLTPPEVLRAKVAEIAAAGFQPAVHAIGDRATSLTLDAFEAAGDLLAVRPRIEHLQTFLSRDLTRLARAGAIASMQPLHATSDGPWVAARLGAGTERYDNSYAWSTVLRAGIPLAFGSDFPVESADPRLGLLAAEARITEGAPAPFLPEQSIPRWDALRAFTWGAAFASFGEGRRGMLREGFDADLTAFSRDVMAVRANELPRVTVTQTIVGGRVEWPPG